MKKGDIVSLIRYHFEHNDVAFAQAAADVARAFDLNGDSELAQYIMGFMSNGNTMSPQVIKEDIVPYVVSSSKPSEPLPLPDPIAGDLLGIVNAVKRDMGIHKILFQGSPGTGKTESVKHIARLLQREVYHVDMATLVDCKLGQTGKNIQQLFRELNFMSRPDKIVVLFDELDSIVLNRSDDNDIREMARAMSLFLKELENLNEQVLLIGTTNLFDQFDKALIRRFDVIIDFNRYTRNDLLLVADKILAFYQEKYPFLVKKKKIFTKIIASMDPIPYPGDLKNLIKTSIAFSSLHDGGDYLRRLYTSALHKKVDDLETMRQYGFSLREMEYLTGISLAQLSRYFKVQEK